MPNFAALVERLGPATPLHRGSPHSSPMYDEFLPEEHETFLDDGTACNRTGGCVKAPGHQLRYSSPHPTGLRINCRICLTWSNKSGNLMASPTREAFS
ncbi:hypothetical protein WJX75_004355 [Coccomyxa subellipsoidea]|uniref:Uncharacterized protein n=1 Tax=Coccomyxa subellipsoidea TaxID=248742 RepID=A0ABR2YQK9_9CHLO